MISQTALYFSYILSHSTGISRNRRTSKPTVHASLYMTRLWIYDKVQIQQQQKIVKDVPYVMVTFCNILQAYHRIDEPGLRNNTKYALPLHDMSVKSLKNVP